MSYSIEITNDDLLNLLEAANKNNIHYELFEGCLQDNFIFYGTENISIDGRNSNHFIIKERFLNTWSSDLVLIMTNFIEEVENFKMAFI